MTKDERGKSMSRVERRMKNTVPFKKFLKWYLGFLFQLFKDALLVFSMVWLFYFVMQFYP